MTAWFDGAPCIGKTHLFFAPDEEGMTKQQKSHAARSRNAKAKKLCAKCDYRVDCLEHAIRNEEIGVWGGTTTQERAAIVRYRKVKQ